MKLPLRAKVTLWPPISPEYLLISSLTIFFLASMSEFWWTVQKHGDRGLQTVRLWRCLTNKTCKYFFNTNMTTIFIIGKNFLVKVVRMFYGMSLEDWNIVMLTLDQMLM